jgi:hypothetical protein
MQNRIDILNELQTLSPLVAGISKVNVFTVPDGYFEQLAARILTGVNEDGGALPAAISSSNFAMQVPQGYFDTLADNILGKIKAQEDTATELQELSPILYSIPNKNVFTVPQGYFENLAGNILNKVNNEADAAAELKELSPMLHGIQSKNVYTVPQGYFESLSENILDKAKPQQAKVVMMTRRRTSIILKYAVAAVFTGLMALGVFKFTGGFAGKTTELPAYVAEGSKIKNVEEALSKISDDEIIKYLQVNGTDVDAALVASTVDEKELPTQEDYLTDDKALDKYLDNIDLTELKN